MSSTSHTEDEQTALWNGAAGRAWVDTQPLLDGMFKPFEDLLVESISAGSAHHVLDVGCGTGGTTLAVARRLGAAGRAVGIDISQPMITVANARAGQLEQPHASTHFICANAQHYAFAPASFDTFISRFGVMFFDDAVQALANLRRAARDHAECWFIAWRSAAENPFMTAAERAAAPLLPSLPVRRDGAPGQFAFADPHRVHGILSDSGWVDIDIRPIDVTCTFPEKELVHYLSRMGPVGAMLQEADEATRRRVLEVVRRAFDPYLQGTEVRFTAACWLFHARAS